MPSGPSHTRPSQPLSLSLSLSLSVRQLGSACGMRYVYLLSSDDGSIIRIFVQINISEVRAGSVVLMGRVSVIFIPLSDNRNSQIYQ